jgi:hypothetical protein
MCQLDGFDHTPINILLLFPAKEVGHSVWGKTSMAGIRKNDLGSRET